MIQAERGPHNYLFWWRNEASVSSTSWSWFCKIKESRYDENFDTITSLVTLPQLLRLTQVGPDLLTIHLIAALALWLNKEDVDPTTLELPRNN